MTCTLNIKNAARYKMSFAIKKGELKRQPCEVCGEVKVDGHHPDYTKPLDVVWLCKKHHAHEHNRMRDINLHFISKVRQYGRSGMVAIPKKLAIEHGISVGSQARWVTIISSNGKKTLALRLEKD